MFKTLSDVNNNCAFVWPKAEGSQWTSNKSTLLQSSGFSMTNTDYLARSQYTGFIVVPLHDREERIL